MSNILRAMSIVVIIFVTLTIFGSMFGIASGKFSITSWLQKFEETQFDVNISDIVTNYLYFTEDWGAFNFIRDAFNGLTYFIGTLLSIIQFALEIIVFAFNFFFDIPVS